MIASTRALVSLSVFMSFTSLRIVLLTSIRRREIPVCAFPPPGERKDEAEEMVRSAKEKSTDRVGSLRAVSIVIFTSTRIISISLMQSISVSGLVASN